MKPALTENPENPFNTNESGEPSSPPPCKIYPLPDY